MQLCGVYPACTLLLCDLAAPTLACLAQVRRFYESMAKMMAPKLQETDFKTLAAT
jgi:hypothetical protein